MSNTTISRPPPQAARTGQDGMAQPAAQGQPASPAAPPRTGDVNADTFVSSQRTSLKQPGLWPSKPSDMNACIAHRELDGRQGSLSAQVQRRLLTKQIDDWYRADWLKGWGEGEAAEDGAKVRPEHCWLLVRSLTARLKGQEWDGNVIANAIAYLQSYARWLNTQPDPAHERAAWLLESWGLLLIESVHAAKERPTNYPLYLTLDAAIPSTALGTSDTAGVFFRLCARLRMPSLSTRHVPSLHEALLVFYRVYSTPAALSPVREQIDNHIIELLQDTHLWQQLIEQGTYLQQVGPGPQHDPLVYPGWDEADVESLLHLLLGHVIARGRSDVIMQATGNMAYHAAASLIAYFGRPPHDTQCILAAESAGLFNRAVAYAQKNGLDTPGNRLYEVLFTALTSRTVNDSRLNYCLPFLPLVAHAMTMFGWQLANWEEPALLICNSLVYRDWRRDMVAPLPGLDTRAHVDAFFASFPHTDLSRDSRQHLLQLCKTLLGKALEWKELNADSFGAGTLGCFQWALGAAMLRMELHGKAQLNERQIIRRFVAFARDRLPADAEVAELARRVLAFLQASATTTDPADADNRQFVASYQELAVLCRDLDLHRLTTLNLSSTQRTS